MVIDKYQSAFRGRTNNVILIDTGNTNLDATVPITVFEQVNLGECLRVSYTQDPLLGGLNFTMLARLSKELCKSEFFY
jgi:hypothetical protein